jgi:hypothetical protein
MRSLAQQPIQPQAEAAVVEGIPHELRQRAPQARAQLRRNRLPGGVATVAFHQLDQRAELVHAPLVRLAEQPPAPAGDVARHRRLVDVQIALEARAAMAAQVLQAGVGAHRNAAQVHALQAQRVEQVCDIVGVVAEQAVLAQVDVVRAPEAAQVGEDEAVAHRQRRDEGQPVRGAHAEAMQQDDRWAAPDIEVVEAIAIRQCYVRHVLHCSISGACASDTTRSCGWDDVIRLPVVMGLPLQGRAG